MALTPEQTRKVSQLTLRLQAELQIIQANNSSIQNLLQKLSLIKSANPADELTGVAYTPEELTAAITAIETEIDAKFPQ